jgi:hypothetical protein
MSAQYAYVNNNVPNNSVLQYTASGLTLAPASSPVVTTGSGLPGVLGANQDGIGTFGNYTCLFASDPATAGGGDVAAFNVVAGTPALVGRFAIPGNTIANKSLPVAVDRRAAYPFVFAAFTGIKKIASFQVNPGCKLTFISAVGAVGLSGFPVAGIAVSPAGPGVAPIGPPVVVVTYQDGSIQPFKISPTGTLAPTAPAFFSTGHGTQGGNPAGVDITANGQYAVFGDDQTITEVEVSAITSGTGVLAPTTDYGGPAVGSGVNLGTGANSSYLWISPGAIAGTSFVYVSNNNSRQVTTTTLNPGGVVGLVTACTSPFTNPTMLHPTGFTESGGIKTQATSGTGSFLYVGEFGTHSAVALLKIQTPSGCTQEVPLSPFIDTFSTNVLSVTALPFRAF